MAKRRDSLGKSCSDTSACRRNVRPTTSTTTLVDQTSWRYCSRKGGAGARNFSGNGESHSIRSNGLVPTEIDYEVFSIIGEKPATRNAKEKFKEGPSDNESCALEIARARARAEHEALSAGLLQKDQRCEDGRPFGTKTTTRETSCDMCNTVIASSWSAFVCTVHHARCVERSYCLTCVVDPNAPYTEDPVDKVLKALECGQSHKPEVFYIKPPVSGLA